MYTIGVTCSIKLDKMTSTPSSTRSINLASCVCDTCKRSIIVDQKDQQLSKARLVQTGGKIHIIHEQCYRNLLTDLHQSTLSRFTVKEDLGWEGVWGAPPYRGTRKVELIKWIDEWPRGVSVRAHGYVGSAKETMMTVRIPSYIHDVPLSAIPVEEMTNRVLPFTVTLAVTNDTDIGSIRADAINALKTTALSALSVELPTLQKVVASEVLACHEVGEITFMVWAFVGIQAPMLRVQTWVSHNTVCDFVQSSREHVIELLSAVCHVVWSVK